MILSLFACFCMYFTAIFSSFSKIPIKIPHFDGTHSNESIPHTTVSPAAGFRRVRHDLISYYVERVRGSPGENPRNGAGRKSSCCGRQGARSSAKTPVRNLEGAQVDCSAGSALGRNILPPSAPVQGSAFTLQATSAPQDIEHGTTVQRQFTIDEPFGAAVGS